MSLVLLVIAVAAVGVAVAFYLQFAQAKARAYELASSIDNASAQAKSARRELEEAREELSRRKTEALELREKLNEVRARSHKQKEAERRQKSPQLHEVQEDLDAARRDLQEAHDRLDVVVRERVGMESEIARLRGETDRLGEALRAARSAPSQSSAPAAVAGPPSELERRLEEASARAASLESQLGELRRKVNAAQEDARKARGKSATLNRMQMLQKGELDLFREKLVWSEKRVIELEKLLFSNQIPLPEREPAPQAPPPQLAPGMLREGTNTAGEGVVAEAADYVPEGEQAPSTETAPSEAPATETVASDVDAGQVAAEKPAEAPAAEPAPVVEAAAEAAPEGEAKSEPSTVRRRRKAAPAAEDVPEAKAE